MIFELEIPIIDHITVFINGIGFHQLSPRMFISYHAIDTWPLYGQFTLCELSVHQDDVITYRCPCQSPGCVAIILDPVHPSWALGINIEVDICQMSLTY